MCLVCRSAHAQFSCSGQGWSDNQCADPFFLYYTPTQGTGAAYFDANGKLTADPTNYRWDNFFHLSVRSPIGGNTATAYILLTQAGGVGGEISVNSNAMSLPGTFANGFEVSNDTGLGMLVHTSTDADHSNALFEGSSVLPGWPLAITGYPSVAFGAALATGATDGFVYLPTSPGTPTGAPRTLPNQFAGTLPVVYDTTHGQLDCYNGSWAPCDPAGAGTVTTVTGTPPIFITSTPTTTPNVTIQGSIVSGSTSTSAINLGTSVSNAILACSTASSTCTPTAVTVAGGLNYNTGTGALTDGSFTCGANTFVSSSSTSGLACTQPAFSNLSGSATCAQLPALTGDATSTAGTCGTKVVEIHESGGLGIPIGACTTDGQAFVKVAGSMTCRLPAGDLSNDYTAPTVIAIEADGAMKGDLLATSIATPAAPSAGHIKIYGNTTADNAMMRNSSGNVTHMMQTAACGADSAFTASADTGVFTCTAASTMVTKRVYAIGALLTPSTTLCPLLSGGNGLQASCLNAEYPNDFQAGHVQMTAYLATNNIAAGTLTFDATRNGSAISGAQFSFTSGTSPGVAVISPQVTGSASASDTYGLAFTTSGSYSSGGSFQQVTFQMVLTP